MKFFIFAFLFGITFLKAMPVMAGPDDVAYFNQFLFRKESHSTDPDFPSFSYRYLMTDYRALYQRPDGTYVIPWISLMLFENGTFWMQYRENYKNSPDDTQFNPGPCKIIEGNWAVPSTRLEVSNFLLGDRALIDGINAIDIHFAKDLVSPGLTSAKLNMTLGTNDSDPRQFSMCWP